MNKQQRQRTKRLIFESLENRWLLAADTLPVELVSTGHPDDPAFAVGNDRSTAQSISADGRFVAFRSAASNLVAGDSNGVDDVFRKDLVTGELALVSTAKSGEIGNGSSTGLAISADGRFVAFSSRATNLVSIDRNGSVADIFVKDMQTGKVTLVSETASHRVPAARWAPPSARTAGTWHSWAGLSETLGLRAFIARICEPIVWSSWPKDLRPKLRSAEMATLFSITSDSSDSCGCTI
jgi:hypothetical protein